MTCIPALSPAKPNDDQPQHLTLFTLPSLTWRWKTKSSALSFSHSFTNSLSSSSTSSKHRSVAANAEDMLRDYTQISIRDGWKCMLVVLLAHARDWLYFTYTLFCWCCCCCLCVIAILFMACVNSFSWIHVHKTREWVENHPHHPVGIIISTRSTGHEVYVSSGSRHHTRQSHLIHYN